MRMRKIGSLEVSSVGLGAMGFSHGYGPSHQIRAHLEASLTRLGTDHVELYYQHRLNKDTPVEEVAACMGELIDDGKILAWGRSQATEEELRRAHAVTR